MPNFFDEPASDDEAPDESFFTQVSPVRRPAARVSSTTGDITASSFRESSLFDVDPRADRTRDESVSLEQILGDGKAPRGTDVQELMRCWRNERAAPEVLMFPSVLVNRLSLNLAKKETVDRLNSVENQHESNYVKLTIAATENMRADYTLKSFLRVRLFKIERYAQALLEDMRDAQERLSPFELRAVQAFVVAWTAYVNAGALNDMPESTQRLEEPDMIQRPDLSQAVFIRARRDCGPVTLPDGERMDLPKDTQHLLRYSTIRELLLQEAVELI